MAEIAIVYHSGYGHTEAVAKEVSRGVESTDGAKAELIKVADAQADLSRFDAADAIIFGTPTYMGSVSAPMKSFMEETSKLWVQRKWKDKIAAGFTNSGSYSGDKLNTLIQLAVFAAQHGMIWVGGDLLPGFNNSKGSPEDLNRVGGYLGLMTQANVDQGPENAPPKSDLKTAQLFGERVARAAHRWKSGV
ncbi:MAG TPA: flavodoxin family protein [bacterium]|nr:flavodoxin family protein [bacterium]